MIDACKAAKLHARKTLDDAELIGKLKHVHSTFSVGFGRYWSWAEQHVRMKKAMQPLGCLGD